MAVHGVTESLPVIQHLLESRDVAVSVRIGLNTEAEGSKAARLSLTPFTYTHNPPPQVQGHDVDGHKLHKLLLVDSSITPLQAKLHIQPPPQISPKEYGSISLKRP